MWRRFALILVALSLPGVSQAQEKRDYLLPAGSQLYIHWDGVEAHKADAEKLAVMKMWKGETGDFIRGLWKYTESVSKQALAGEIGAEMAGAIFDEFGGMFNTVGAKGFSLGAELESVDPIKMQLTLVFPDGAGKTKSPLSFMNTMSKLDKEAKVKTLKQGNRQVSYLQAEMFYFAWWAEGKDAVWSVGTTDPATLLKGLDNPQGGLGGNALFKEVRGFKEFPVWMRGYFDLPSLLRVVGKAQPIVNNVTTSLGLDGIKNFTFFSGFDGPAERAVFFTNLVKGPRKGILKAISGKTFTLNDLPPMPADLHGFSAATVNWGGAYEATIDFMGTLLNLVPIGAPDVKQLIKDFEKDNNVSVGAIFNAMDPLYVNYAASAEGFLGLGQTQLFKAKDEKRLAEELGKILRQAQKGAGGIVSLKEQQYHGATLHTISFNSPVGQEDLSRLYYTVHKGWLALSQYPQPLKGFILRANGELPTWKAGPELMTKLKPFPTEFSGIAISDPRPTMKLVLSVLPPLIDIGQKALDQAAMGKFAGKRFDISLIPNAYEATKYLFPNITISTIDGDTIRAESRSSLSLGF